MHLRQALAGALKPVLGWMRERPIRAGLVGLLAVLFAFFLAVMAYGEPAWAYWLFGPAEKFRVLEFVGIAMGGVLLAIGAEIANRRAVALEGAAKAQAGAAQAQAEANKGAEDGRRQERLKNAIEHLGHDSDSVRLGGAYELFHLAKDIDYLRQTVLDILCAHIRRTTGEDEYRERYKSKPSEEIQSLLTLLFVQEHAVFEGCRANLQGSCLNGADIANGRLERANLIGVQLKEATLMKAQMRDANLDGALMQKVDLDMVQMQEASLVRAQMQGASFIGARLQGASLSGAHLQGAKFVGACLQGVKFVGARLQGASLLGARLQGAILFTVQLQGAFLFEAQLQGASLVDVQLQGTTCQFPDNLSYAAHLRSRANQKSDLSYATFAGGLSWEDVDSLVKGLPGGRAEVYRRALELHIGKLASHEPPEGSSVATGVYTKEEAERWIAEYEEAMRGVPEAERA